MCFFHRSLWFASTYAGQIRAKHTQFITKPITSPSKLNDDDHLQPPFHDDEADAWLQIDCLRVGLFNNGRILRELPALLPLVIIESRSSCWIRVAARSKCGV